MRKKGASRRLRWKADQLLIWKAAIALMDGRTVWPRAMKLAIEMIEASDPAIVQEQKRIRFEGRRTPSRALTAEGE